MFSVNPDSIFSSYTISILKGKELGGGGGGSGTGPTGPTGVDGSAVNTGAKGDTGDIGPTGLQGPTGVAGSAVNTGAKGDTGSIGPTGQQGDTGPAGFASNTGATGDTGSIGPTGQQGDTGPAGTSANTGGTGPTGEKGDTGPTGFGSTGPTGAGGAGATGQQGDTGAVGPTGPAGSGGGSLPAGTNYGDYLYWDSNTATYAVGDASVVIGGHAGEFSQESTGIAIGYYAGQNTQFSNAIAIGVNAGQNIQGGFSVSIGTAAGQDSQGQNAISIGGYAGNSLQGTNSVAIGLYAGYNNQAENSIILNATGGILNGATSNALYVAPVRADITQVKVLGYDTVTNEVTYFDTPTGGGGSLPPGTNYGDYLYWDSNTSTYAVGDANVVIGGNAGAISQQANAVAVGYNAGNDNQGQESVAIGNNAGQFTQGAYSIAIGDNAGNDNQGQESVAIGKNAGQFTQGAYSIAIGDNAGHDIQGPISVAIGNYAGYNAQGEEAVAIGDGAGSYTQGVYSVAIGAYAGSNLQGQESIAIGDSAGTNTQGEYSVAIGYLAAAYNQGVYSTAIGPNAGRNTQGQYAVAIGFGAGQNGQGGETIAMGINSGANEQGKYAVSVGSYAGENNQGESSVAIGANAATDSGGFIGGEWVQYKLPFAIVLKYYQLASYVAISDPDYDAENPYEWYLLASNDDVSWTEIDYQSGQDYTKWSNYLPQYYNTYAVQNNKAYQYYRLVVTSRDPSVNTGGAYGWSLFAFNLIEDGSTLSGTPGHEFVDSGNVYPNVLLNSADEQGYVTTQSVNIPDPLYLLSAQYQSQTLGSLQDVSLFTGNLYYPSLYNPSTLLYGGPFTAISTYASASINGNSISIGNSAGQNSQANHTIALGNNAGQISANGLAIGEWIQYKLPSAIVLKYYQLAAYVEFYPETNYYDTENPYEWYLLASNDGAIWSAVDYQSDQDYTKWANVNNDAVPQYYNTYTIQNNTTAYQYYRLVVSRIDPAGNQGYNNTLLYAFNLIQGGSLTSQDGHGFLDPISGGTAYPAVQLLSADEQGYQTSQSPGFTGFFPSATGCYVLSSQYQSQTLGSLVVTYTYTDNVYGGTAINLYGVGMYTPERIGYGYMISDYGAGMLVGNSVAIGTNAGQGGQQEYAIAIGANAGTFNQAANTIILNASGVALNNDTTDPALYIAPIRGDITQTKVLGYNTTTKEVTYFDGGTSLPAGTNYGDYLYWNGSTYAVGDTNVVIGGHAGQTNQGPGSVAIGYQAGSNNQTRIVPLTIAGEWFTYASQNPITPNYLQLSFNGVGAFANSFSIVASNDNVNWTQIGQRLNIPASTIKAAGDGYNTCPLYAYIPYQYYRVIFTNCGDAFSDITVYAFNLIVGGTIDADGLSVDGTAYPGLLSFPASGSFPGLSSHFNKFNPASTLAGSPQTLPTKTWDGFFYVTNPPPFYDPVTGNYTGENTTNADANLENSIAIGYQAAQNTQGYQSIAIGASAGQDIQNINAIAIGALAGASNQGTNAIAIGQLAGQIDQGANSIILNASGSILNAAANALCVKPVRNAADASAGNLLMYNSASGEFGYSTDNTSASNKTFVIQHPDEADQYLVHACLEGPEAGVYYRGEGVIADGEKKVVITLPAYVKNLATDLTVHLTPVLNDEDIEDETPFNIRSTRVRDNSFTVYANKAVAFHWVVFGKRGDVKVEVNKSDAVMRGDGPYRWLDTR